MHISHKKYSVLVEKIRNKIHQHYSSFAERKYNSQIQNMSQKNLKESENFEAGKTG